MKKLGNVILAAIIMCSLNSNGFAQSSTKDILPIKRALELASEAAKEDPRFAEMSIISASLVLVNSRSPLLPKDLPDGTHKLWSIVFSKHYPTPPGTRYFAEVTFNGDVYLRAVGR